MRLDESQNEFSFRTVHGHFVLLEKVNLAMLDEKLFCHPLFTLHCIYFRIFK